MGVAAVAIGFVLLPQLALPLAARKRQRRGLKLAELVADQF